MEIIQTGDNGYMITGLTLGKLQSLRNLLSKSEASTPVQREVKIILSNKIEHLQNFSCSYKSAVL